MDKRIGLVGIVIEDPKHAPEHVNTILSEFSDIIIGRMGLPYKKRAVSVISVIVDGTNDKIGAMCGKIGRIENVSVKSVLTSKTYSEEEEK